MGERTPMDDERWGDGVWAASRALLGSSKLHGASRSGSFVPVPPGLMATMRCCSNEHTGDDPARATKKIGIKMAHKRGGGREWEVGWVHPVDH
jgi:hypothetical protein